MPKLAAGVQRKPPEEKVTINLGAFDLGRIDLLVREGFYASRTDLIRTAIRTELARHDAAVNDAALRQSLVLGLRRVERSELETARLAGRRITLHVLGVLEFADDIEPALVRGTIESVTVLGSLRAPEAVIEALRPVWR